MLKTYTIGCWWREVWIACALLFATTSLPAETPLFQYQYGLADSSFTCVMTCVDFDGDGSREMVHTSRQSDQVSLIDAQTGQAKWTVTVSGDQQTTSAYDLDRDGQYEILYTTSNPGNLHLLNPANGAIEKTYASGNHKLGNAPVIIDGDHDGVLDGYFGDRSNAFHRVNMSTFTGIATRTPWTQCGAQTSALDVDKDGQWDLFAGSGDDSEAEGVLHRINPKTLGSVWSYPVKDNASSADAVLVDLDGDGKVEILKSVDNYAGEDAHDGVYAFDRDGTLRWKASGYSGEDTPNAADLKGNGQVRIVGMTFAGEVYCLDAQGNELWKKDLRPELGAETHQYMAPILCDLDGDAEMEILAMTNGGHTSATAAHGVVYALSADGEVLGELDVGGDRFWGAAFCANIDDDPYLELVVSGLGGMDVIETRGFGPNTEHFTRRRDYRRLNVLPWAYEDTFFIHRGERQNVENRTDNLVLAKDGNGYHLTGRFVTELLTLAPGFRFDKLLLEMQTPDGCGILVNLLDKDGNLILANVQHGDLLNLEQDVRIEFLLSSENADVTPLLDSYSLSFTAVPEPSVMGPLLLAGLFLRRRRRRKELK